MTNTSSSSGNAAGDAVILFSMGELKELDNGRVYFEVWLKKGILGKPTRRSLWGQKHEDGTLQWERASPEEIQQLIGANVSGHAFVEIVEHEPKEITVSATGERLVITSCSVVRFADESEEQVVRRYGLVKRDDSVPTPQPVGTPGAPAGFALVGVNGPQG